MSTKLRQSDLSPILLSIDITKKSLYDNLEGFKNRLKTLYKTFKTKKVSPKFKASYHDVCDNINFRELYPNTSTVDLNRPLFIQHIFEQWNRSSISERKKGLERMTNGLIRFRKLLTEESASGHSVLKNLFLCIQGRLQDMQKIDRFHYIDENGHHHGRCVNYGHITPITEAIYLLQYFKHIAKRIDNIIKSASVLENIDYGNILSFNEIKRLYRLDMLPGWEIYDRVKFNHSEPKRCIYEDDQISYDPSTSCPGCGLPRDRCTCLCERCDKNFNECQCDDIDDVSITKEECKDCDQLNCVCPSFSSSVGVTCATCKQTIDTSFLHIIGMDRYISFFHPQCSVPVCESCEKYISIEDPSSVITKNGIRYHKKCYVNEQKSSPEYGLCEICNQPCITYMGVNNDVCVHMSCLAITSEKEEKSIDYDEAMSILIKHDLIDITNSSSSMTKSSFGKRKSSSKKRKSIGKRKTK